MTDEAVMVTSSSGGVKGQKSQQFSQLPLDVLMELTTHYYAGSQKYDRFNWTKGYDWSLSYDALQRHLSAFWMGESIDAETGSRHLMGVIFHALALAWFELHRGDFDDRFNWKQDADVDVEAFESLADMIGTGPVEFTTTPAWSPSNFISAAKYVCPDLTIHERYDALHAKIKAATVKQQAVTGRSFWQPANENFPCETYSFEGP